MSWESMRPGALAYLEEQLGSGDADAGLSDQLRDLSEAMHAEQKAKVGHVGPPRWKLA
jgi:hypothetical protein